jgi:F420-dependent oxidoreductase-like protein
VRIAIGVGGEVVGVPMTPADVVRQACDAEAAGFEAAWTVHFSRGLDALSVLAVAGGLTNRIELGVGVVPTYPRHPHALAQQAATVQALLGGRLTLGVGVSHKPVIEGLFGLVYDSPVAHLQEYLSVLVPLLRDGTVTHRGRTYAVDGGFAVPGTSRVEVLVGALSPRTSALAGELADGVVTAWAGPRTLESVVGPALRGAAGPGRAPRLVAAVPVAVCADADAARTAAAAIFARYGTLENYQRLFAREGVGSVADLAVVGSEDDVALGLRGYADAGATELWAVPFPVGGGDGNGSGAGGDIVRRTTNFLAALARGDAPTRSGTATPGPGIRTAADEKG